MNHAYSLIATAVLLVVPAFAEAQSSSIFGNRGVTAQSGTMGNGLGGGSSGTGNSQQFGTVSGFLGTNATDQRGFATGAQPTSQMPGAGSGNFVGNRNSAASTQGANGQRAGNRAGGAGGRNSLSSGMNRSNSNRNRQSQNAGGGAANSSPIRPTQVIAFQPPARTGEGITSAINSDISSAVSQGRIPGVAVVADAQGNVTLDGHVGTEADRRKAEMLVRLEPGVRNIVNRITVQE